jgi:thymidylate synthase (FAD)
LELGARPQEARSVLPNSLKTEIVMTANLREWRHVFRLRCDRPAHPQMRQVMLPLLAEFQQRIPVVFDDLRDQFADALAGLPGL